MTRPVAPLPTPEQIAETPELLVLHTLENGLELMFRTLLSIHPGLDDPEVPYWALDPSRTRQAAHRLVLAAAHLETRIQEYLTALDLDQRTHAARPEDDRTF